MRKKLLIRLVYLACSCWLMCAGSQAGEEKIKLVGDETKLAKVKASPKEFFGKEITATGAIKTSAYFNYAYEKAQSTHFAFDFQEVLGVSKSGDTEEGEECNLYFDKTKGKVLADKVAEVSPKRKLIRVKAAIVRRDPLYAGDVQWDMMEMLDYQLLGEDGNWGHWASDIEKKEKQKEAEERARFANAAKEKRDKEQAERKAAADLARWHTWSINGEKLEAKFLKGLGDKIYLQKKDGTKIEFAKDEISKEDLAWIKHRVR